MKTKIVFPALVIGKGSIDKINYRHFSGSREYINTGYKDVVIIDSEGNFFQVSGTRQVGGVSIIDSIKNVGILVKLDPVLKEPTMKIQLEELKAYIINFIKEHSSTLRNLDDKDSLVKYIKESTKIIDVINIF